MYNIFGLYRMVFLKLNPKSVIRLIVPSKILFIRFFSIKRRYFYEGHYTVLYIVHNIIKTGYIALHNVNIHALIRYLFILYTYVDCIVCPHWFKCFIIHVQLAMLDKCIVYIHGDILSLFIKRIEFSITWFRKYKKIINLKLNSFYWQGMKILDRHQYFL